MGTAAMKVKKTSSTALFFRQTIQSDILEGVVKIPNDLKHRLLEMILLPIEVETKAVKDKVELSRFAGAWSGEPLERADQGVFETREELQ